MTLTRNEKKYCENGEVGEGNGGRGEVLGGSLFDLRGATVCRGGDQGGTGTAWCLTELPTGIK